MPPESALIEARRRLERPDRSGHLRLVREPVPRVVDVALFYGQRSGGIRTYVDARARWAHATGRIDHHVIVPGEEEGERPGVHGLPSVRVGRANGYRLPRTGAALEATLRALEPDVVVLHDPFWRPLTVARAAAEIGARTVAVHHGSVALDAAGLPGPARAWAPGLRRWMHHAYADADHVMSAVPCREDCGRGATMTLRFGLHPAFVPRTGIRRRDHVLYVGRLAREKGVDELLHAAAAADEPWPLRLVGSGPEQGRLQRLARRLGIAGRVTFGPFIPDPLLLARAYAQARAVVMPGAHETFGLVAFEAAACGARVVTASNAPSVRHYRELAHTFAAGDAGDLLQAIEAARAAEPDPRAAAALAQRSSWGSVFEAELADLERLDRRPR